MECPSCPLDADQRPQSCFQCSELRFGGTWNRAGTLRAYRCRLSETAFLTLAPPQERFKRWLAGLWRAVVRRRAR